MSYNFIFTTKAEEDLLKLELIVRKRILKKIAQLEKYENIKHVAKPLTGDFSTYSRIRVGRYRLVCEIEDEIITVLKVQHRKDVYK